MTIDLWKWLKMWMSQLHPPHESHLHTFASHLLGASLWWILPGRFQPVVSPVSPPEQGPWVHAHSVGTLLCRLMLERYQALKFVAGLRLGPAASVHTSLQLSGDQDLLVLGGSGSKVHQEIQNVHFRIWPGVLLQVAHLPLLWVAESTISLGDHEQIAATLHRLKGFPLPEREPSAAKVLLPRTCLKEGNRDRDRENTYVYTCI